MPRQWLDLAWLEGTSLRLGAVSGLFWVGALESVRPSKRVKCPAGSARAQRKLLLKTGHEGYGFDCMLLVPNASGAFPGRDLGSPPEGKRRFNLVAAAFARRLVS